MLRPCLTCGRPVTTPRCRQCGGAGIRQRGSTSQRGYGTSHQRRAAALRAQHRPCCLCGEQIDYDAPAIDPAAFQAHHLTDDKHGPLDAAHRLCNAQAGQPSRS